MTHNEELIHYFGYSADDNPNNITPYFDYKGKAKADSVKMQGKFKELNVKATKMRQE